MPVWPTCTTASLRSDDDALLAYQDIAIFRILWDWGYHDGGEGDAAVRHLGGDVQRGSLTTLVAPMGVASPPSKA